jgi:glycerophosphoryl diester phosphodiesterase
MHSHLLCEPAARVVIAHRGGARRAPENTLPALTGAAALGADAVELDVRLSRDGEVVVIHDPTVDRTTQGRGEVRALTALQLESLDAGFRFTVDRGATHPFRGSGIGVPRLADVVAATGGMPLLIEIKAPEALAPTVALLERLGATERAVVAASAFAAVAPARGGRLRTGASARDASALLFALRGPARLTYEALCIPPRHFGIPLPIRFLAGRARRCGAATHVWTINDPAVALRLWRAGVSGIVTDLPDVMAAVRTGDPARGSHTSR